VLVFHHFILERQDTFFEVEDEIPTNDNLDELFQSELSRATVLAEFHERYIHRVLERRRELNDNTTNLGHFERHRIWQETMNDHPMLALENIGRSLRANPARPSVLEQQDSEATIQEIVDSVVEISASSHSFSQFILTDVPQLHLDEQLLNGSNQ
jgi:hypothetical protein